MKFFFFACFLFAFLYAINAQNPTISPNFMANIVLKETDNRNVSRNLTGMVYVDFTGTQDRLDTTDDNVNFELLNLYTTHNQYDIIGIYCIPRPLEREMENPWGWVADATNLGTCDGIIQKRVGTLWGHKRDGATFGVCVGTGNIPFWLEMVDARVSRFFIYTTFTAGRPNSSFFAVPSSCPK